MTSHASPLKSIENAVLWLLVVFPSPLAGGGELRRSGEGHGLD